MNWDTVKGDWKQFQGRVKEQWGKLTDDDLNRIEGRRDQLAGTIQKRYGIEKDEAERQVSAFEQQCMRCEESRTGPEPKSQSFSKGEGSMKNPNKAEGSQGREAHQQERHRQEQPSPSMNDPKAQRQPEAGGERMKDKNMGKEDESKRSGAHKEQSKSPRAKK